MSCLPELCAVVLICQICLDRLTVFVQLQGACSDRGEHRSEAQTADDLRDIRRSSLLARHQSGSVIAFQSLSESCAVS